MVWRDRIEQTVVGLLIDPAEACTTYIGQTRAESIAEQSEEAEDP
jgi:hypothetical protein